MEQTSTKVKAAIEPCLVSCFTKPKGPLGVLSRVYQKFLLLAFAMIIGTIGFAHTVDSYSAVCGSGPQYTVTATVSSVNTSSNYRWQWKNTSGAWVCFVNGANTINGTSYNVSGAVYNLTTTPGPLVFTNPGSGLQGLEIRMVISDGSGVNPCNLPAGNTWTSSTNHFINITGSPCATTTPCSCPGNLVTNPSFENGTTGWSWSGGNFNAGNGAVACGSFSGDFQITNASSNWVSQTIGTDLAIGTVINTKVYAGTHNNSFYHAVSINFFDANWTWLSSSVSVEVNKVLSAAPTGPQLYNITATVPAGAKYTQVSFGGNGDWIKTDQWCVTTTPPVCTGRVTSVYFNRLDGGADLPITNGATFTTTQLGALYNFEAATTGTVGSVKYTITGPTPSSNIENTAPYNSPGTGSGAWTYTPGTYSVNLKTYYAADATSIQCHDTTITFTVIDNAVSLGNQVYIDRNDNGLFEPSLGDFGYDGAVVRVYADNNDDGVADGAALATRTTAGGGFYNFTNLAPGKYFVQIESVPSWMFKTTVNGGDPDNDIDNDNNGLTQNTTTAIIKGGTITLSAGGETGGGNTNNTYDFGIFKTNGLGDFVFLDANANGVQDAGENGIAGVIVNLRNTAGALLATTTTGTNGYYFFYDPAEYGTNNYNIEFITPAGYTASPANQGGDDAKDSDPIGGVITNVNVPNGTWNHTFDAGFVPPLMGSIGDRVWNDTDRDGIQDPGEVGVAGVTVSLYNSTGALVATTFTDAFGNYLFSNLPVSAAGINYQVRFSLPAEFTFSPQNAAGSTAANNSDANVTTGRTGNVTLTTANKDRTDIDAGIYYTIPARIGDFIWNDLDKDGVQDAGEPGIAGVTVTLYDNAGNPLRTTITDNNGYYQFTDVALGTYTIGLTPPVGYVLSGANTTNDDQDSDFDAATFRTAPFTVTAGTTDLSFDGGLNVTPPTRAAVGDKVWNDLNNNGLQDGSEPGVPGVTVQLYSYIGGVGTLIGTRTTDAFGNYMFNNLPAGDYYIRFTNLPAGYTLVAPNVGGASNGAIDSDVTGTFGAGTTQWFNLLADETRVTVDAGIRNATALSSLGDFVWYDGNKNGIQDASEAGVPGVTVTLYNAATGAVIKTLSTDANGRYLFTDLPNGTYALGFSNLPSGYVFTGKDLTADGADSDVDPSTGRTGVYTIAAPGTNLTVDAGIFATPNVNNAKATIGDKVWNDVNGNGVQDAGEPGVAGVTVILYAGDGTTVIGTTTTDGAGNYIFTNLDAGNYVVGFSNLPAGFAFTTQNVGADPTKDSNPNTGTGKTAAITLAAGEINLTIDAGIKGATVKSALGDRVWYDVNSNGIQDAGENGAAGVSVTFYNAAGTAIATTVTDANGAYLFADLDAGTYTVGFGNLPAGYTATTPNAAGSTAANNSDANIGSLRTGNIVLPAATTDLNWDLGIVSTTKAALGNYVWLDANNNGIQDATEKGAPGVTVTLYDASNNAIASAVTDATGFYMFNNLNAGTYTVGFSNLPVNTTFTTKAAAGSTAANNSDVNVATGRTDAVVLTAGQVRTDIDAGLISNFAAVGDFVWYDVDANGRQDANEPGAPGVTVNLINVATGAVVASAVTDGKGRYFINNIPVPAGGTSFVVEFKDLPINTVGYTIKNAAGATAATNSNANPASGRTDAFTLLPGQVDLTIDAGIITDGGGPLPVTFTNLSGVYNNGVSKLSWATLSEQNFSHFEVEYSKDGVGFNHLGNVAGAGNSNNRIDYGFNHLLPIAGANYYRLKMVDRDGRYTYSNIVLLNVTIKGLVITAVYPNPFIDKVNVGITSAAAEKAKIKLFDNAGKLVYSNETMIQVGINTISISNLNKLAAGSYMIQVSAGDAVLTKQLMK